MRAVLANDLARLVTRFPHLLAILSQDIEVGTFQRVGMGTFESLFNN